VFEPATARTHDPRRLGLGAAVIIAGYAIVVALISAGVIGDLVADDVGPPPLVPRPIALGAMFMLPAAVAAIGAVRRSGPILTAAGVLCLGQSFVAFSGVTIPFVVPAFLLLLILGARSPVTERPPRALAGALLVVALGIAAWVAPAVLSETTCWIARSTADGTITYTRIPVTDTSTVGPGEVAAGCDGGDLTFQGAGVAMVLWIGAVAIAGLASTGPSRPERQADGTA
jgi:hypothetical protein